MKEEPNILEKWLMNLSDESFNELCDIVVEYEKQIEQPTPQESTDGN